jgi:hypothetical protein
MRDDLIRAFPSIIQKELSDEYIEEHYDLMWDVPDIPLIRAVPLYMLWCIEHPKDEGALVFDNTISALNNYSRTKKPSAEWQDFKFSCNQIQIEAVKQFLQWCETELILDYEPSLSRAIKNWQSVKQ